MMGNAEVAAAFDEIADGLELEGANPFRVRAYRNAARVVRELPQPALELDLEEQPGIGADLAGKIRALAEGRPLPLLEELRARLPQGLRAMMGVPGLGPKRAMALHKGLGISSLEGLRAAAEQGRLRELPGFGERTEQAILRSMRGLEAEGRRVLLAEARGLLAPLLAHLSGTPGLAAIEPAGSYRRRRETVGDLDVLACAARPGPVMERLASYGALDRVLARGGTRMSVRLKGGLQVDLRVVPEESFGSALQYFTGSKAHGILVRARAQERGLKLNEYGVFRGRRRVAGRTEEEVYAAVGLPLIPPELREARGELDLAAAGRLPRLVELSDLQGDLHMHTTLTDGRAPLEEMLEAASARGLRYVAVTEHSKRVTMARGLDDEGLLAAWRRLEKAAPRFPRLTLLKGVEVDILDDGSLDISEDVLARADWVLAALHYGQRQPREQLTRRLVAAAANPVVSAIAHPTGRLIGRRPPYDADMEAVIQAVADHGCVLEVDGQPERLDLDDVLIAAAKAKGVRFALDSDAHSAAELAFQEGAVFQARRGGLTAEDVLNARPWEELRTLLRRPAPVRRRAARPTGRAGRARPARRRAPPRTPAG